MSFVSRCQSCAALLRRSAWLPQLQARGFASTAAAASAATSRYRPVPDRRGKIDSPGAFLAAISRKPRRDLTADSGIVDALGDDWVEMFKIRGEDLRAKGVGIKERRYLLWAIERFRQGQDPKDYAYQPKPKKVIRGWGARVQKGIRVSGRQRPGEK